MDVNGKGPLVDPSAEWVRAASSGRHRTTERHRVRRRARRSSAVRAKIRVRMWIACTGALLVMAIVIYLAIGRERGGEAGFRFVPSAAPALAVARPTFVAG